MPNALQMYAAYMKMEKCNRTVRVKAAKEHRLQAIRNIEALRPIVDRQLTERERVVA